MNKKISKKHLKHLFSCHADIEKRIAELNAINNGAECSVCHQGTFELQNAELKGLQHGETLIDAIINDYLNNYGG